MQNSKWIRYVSFSLALLSSLTCVLGQENTVFEATVTDGQSQANIPFATIAMYFNGKLIDGTITDESGHFKINTDSKVSEIEISFIGYESQRFLIDDWTHSDNRIIQLLPQAEQLNEVTISGDRTHSQLAIDRKIINLGSDLQQSGATALEAFDQLTEIQTDLSTGSVSLRGSGNVRLLINGKPTAMSPAEILAQIPASSIDQIEIITSPSAKNQADGLSGIVNIKLKKNRERGLNLAVNGGIGTKRNHYGVLGNYNVSNINFRWNASEANREMDSKQSIQQRYTNGNTRDFIAPHDFKGVVRKVGMGIDLFFEGGHELSVETDYTFDHHDFINFTFYNNVTDQEDFIYLRNSSHTHKTSTVTTNYRKSFDTEQHFLELDFNYSKNDNLLPAEDFNNDQFLFEEEKSNHNTLQSLALDYSRPLGDKTTIETGFLWNNRAIGSFDFFAFDSLPDIQGNFTYREDQFGIYALAKTTLGQLSIQSGLRLEQFNSNSINHRNDQLTDLQFFNVFPSLHLSYQISEQQTMNLGYAKRVSRPNFNHVNPFRMGNQYFRWQGNAALSPEFSDNVEFNLQFNGAKWSYSASAFYRYRTDVIERIQTIDTEGVQTIGFDNIGKKHSYGIETTLSYQALSFWDVSTSYNYYRTDIREQLFITWDQLFSSSLQLKNTFQITKNIRTDLTFRHTGKNQNVFDYREPRNRLDWAARARLLENRLTLSVRVIDVLNNNLLYRSTVTPEVLQKEVWKFQSQTFGYLFSLEYKVFDQNNTSRKRKKRNYSHRGATD